MPDVTAIGEKNDVEELGRLLQLVLGIAVNCARKNGKKLWHFLFFNVMFKKYIFNQLFVIKFLEYIEAVMSCEEDIQHDVMKAIQEVKL